MNPNAFPAYDRFDPSVPVWCLTPNRGAVIHRFFDSSPVSPSGRYVALFRLPFEDHVNKPGDTGHVVLVDLDTGEEKQVAESRGWEMQVGASVNWGADDQSLFFNDLDAGTGEPVAVKLDPVTDTRTVFPGGQYRVARNGRFAVAPSLACMRRTQEGYGVILPDDRTPRNIGAPDDDGVFRTDLSTGERRLILPLSEAARHIEELRSENLSDWEVYGFHTSLSPDDSRLLLVLRWFPVTAPKRFYVQKCPGMLRYAVLTMDADGSNVQVAIPYSQWRKGGHHPCWMPDSERVSMNLNIDGEGLRFVCADADGSNLRKLHPVVQGSGHPSVHPDGRHILVDVYAVGDLAYDDGTVPLRLIDIETGEDREILRIGAVTTPRPTSTLRVDPHPAWDRSWRYAVFNGVLEDNTRRVFLADLSPALHHA
jgi:hypothetical protein